MLRTCWRVIRVDQLEPHKQPKRAGLNQTGSSESKRPSRTRQQQHAVDTIATDEHISPDTRAATVQDMSLIVLASHLSKYDMRCGVQAFIVHDGSRIRGLRTTRKPHVDQFKYPDSVSNFHACARVFTKFLLSFCCRATNKPNTLTDGRVMACYVVVTAEAVSEAN